MEDRERGFSPEVIEAREHSGNERVSFDTLRSIVDNSPLVSGGSNFKTHVLKKESNSRISYKPSVGMALFASLFTCIGLVVLTLGIFHFIGVFDEKSNKTIIFTSLFGSTFVLAGGFMLYRSYKPRVFDKQSGLFRKSYKTKLHGREIDNSEDHIRLNEIAAIQLLGEHIQSDDGSYKSFELNLVLEDGIRKNVVDHGSLKTIVKDARILSEFLDVPIWHAGAE